MPIIKTALNYTQGNQTNIYGNLTIPITPGDSEVILVEWGHFVPAGTDFIEVQTTVGWEGPELFDALEFRLYQNGALVAMTRDQADDIGTDNPITTSFDAILTSLTNQHNVYQLAVVVFRNGTVQDIIIKGPLNVSTVSYGTP